VYTKWVYTPRKLFYAQVLLLAMLMYTSESGTFYRDINPALCPKRSRSSPPFLWAQLLALTEPTEWTPHATFACTKIFVSNLKPTEVRVFLEGVLLDKCRDDMRMNGGKLNVHLYEALKKSLYKPAAFFKGILFPLCEVSGGPDLQTDIWENGRKGNCHAHGNSPAAA
jgi:hypothetical protein